MQPNLLEVMKSRAGIPTNDLFAMLWAQKLRAGSSSVQTLTGIPPLSFKGNGKPLISLSMLGNGQQTGTPTPDAPIMPTFCGVRTGNLYARNYIFAYIDSSGNVIANAANVMAYAKVEPNTTYTVSADLVATNGNRIALFTDIPVSGSAGSNIATISSQNYEFTITTNADTKYVAWHTGFSTNDRFALFIGTSMLNLGNTALPYEPYGWAEKITCGGQTTPIYLGQVQTVRRIRKLVLTGEEAWLKGTYAFYTAVDDITVLSQMYCTHYVYYNGTSSGMPDESICNGGESAVWIRPINFSSISIGDFEAYLAAQYANGTPVTVWYVLAEPETGIVNEPLCKIGDYADELHSEDAGVTIPTVKGQNTLTVDTELQPSSMTITFKG